MSGGFFTRSRSVRPLVIVMHPNIFPSGVLITTAESLARGKFLVLSEDSCDSAHNDEFMQSEKYGKEKQKRGEIRKDGVIS